MARTAAVCIALLSTAALAAPLQSFHQTRDLAFSDDTAELAARSYQRFESRSTPAPWDGAEERSLDLFEDLDERGWFDKQPSEKQIQKNRDEALAKLEGRLPEKKSSKLKETLKKVREKLHHKNPPKVGRSLELEELDELD